MKKYWQEFRQFAIKGNVVDLAVAVIIGGAFGKIVSSLVTDIVMPLVGVLLGGVNFNTWSWVLEKASYSEDGTLIQAEVVVNIGNFVQNIFDFFVIAISVFFMIKIIMKSKEQLFRKDKIKEEKGESVKVISEEQKLLTEIRDILKSNNK